MSDMKDKMKGFMKKVNNQLSSPSGKFKGQGRVLGSASSSSPGPIYPNQARPTQQYVTPRANPVSNPKSNPPPPSSSSSSSSSSYPADRNRTSLPEKNPGQVSDPATYRKPEDGFDPYDPLITNGKRSTNGYFLNVIECPICGKPFKTEDEVSIHVDEESCINNSSNENPIEKNDQNDVVSALEAVSISNESRSNIEVGVAAYLSGKPKEGSVEVVLKLLKNIVKEPDNGKFRRIRMSNPKIKEAIGEIAGGVELFEFVGFELKDEDGEMWAVMEVPNGERVGLITKVIGLLEPKKVEEAEEKKGDKLKGEASAEVVEPKKFDRQIRVFLAVSEGKAARIELPDSFYNISAQELKREAEMRRKKIEESQMLIPRSYREKQAQAAKRRYNRTIIRIQFPDRVVLQGVFRPWEQTTVLYEFVSSALKEPFLQFDLINPVAIKRRVVPRFPAAGEKPRLLEEEDLVPSALIKFRPIETDSVMFTGLCNELLEISEPLE